MPASNPPPKHIISCGTRAVYKIGPFDYRVTCATCVGGGTVRHPTRKDAIRAAVKTSAMACRACGAD